METVKESTFIEALLPLVIIIFIIAVGVVLLYQHFQKNLFIQKLQQQTLKNIHQHELLRTSMHVQEEERKRIAQDLHDELGAVLSIMRMNMLILEQKHTDTGDNLLTSLQNIRTLAETALSSARNISHRLMPPQLASFGLVKTLESVIDQINAAGKLDIQLIAPENMPPLSWDTSIGLYRSIMELINNTIKHAGATTVTIALYTQDKWLTCRYGDNGKGLAQGNDDRNGLGHISIDARIKSLEGKFEIIKETASGFHASIQVPAGKKDAATA